MKIVLVCPRSFLYRHPAWPGINRLQPQALWAKALKKLGHEVTVFPVNMPLFPKPAEPNTSDNSFKEFLKSQYVRTYFHRPFSDFHDRLNTEKLLKTLKQREPDLVILSGGQGLRLPLGVIKRICGRFRTVLFNGMSYAYSTARERKAAPGFSMVVCNDPDSERGWKSFGAKRALALPISACDPDFHTPGELKRDIPVSFIGTLLPRYMYQRRINYLEEMARNGVEFRLYTPHKKQEILSDLLRKFYSGSAAGEKMIQVLQRSRISLNPNGYSFPFMGNLKTFEIPACGALEVADYAQADWFSSAEVIVEADPAAAAKKVKSLVSRPDEISEMAGRARLKAHKMQTYENRFKRFFNFL